MTKNHHTVATIHLRGIELSLHLGWGDTERAQRQGILVDVVLCFATPPKACDTDNLRDTYCYDELIQSLTHETEPREFRLIEHLAAHLYHFIKKNLPRCEKVSVAIEKDPRSYIPNLTRGVVFTFGDVI